MSYTSGKLPRKYTMPKMCESCRFYTTEDSETTCPVCTAALRSTLLPPAWGPELTPGAVPHAPPRSPRLVFGIGALWESVIGSPIGLVVLCVLGLALSWAMYDWAIRDPGPGFDNGSLVKVGMHFSEVGRVLDVGPPPTPSYPRMRDHFPEDEFGDGRLDYEGNGVKLTVYFVGGYVSSVKESPSNRGPGVYKFKYIIHER